MTGVSPEPRELKIRYFAWVREKTGRSEETVRVPASVETISELMAWLKARGPEFDAAFAVPATVRAAIDRVHVKAGASITSAREIAFFPPVTGG